jgi:ADP-ribose pyrophosphatase
LGIYEEKQEVTLDRKKIFNGRLIKVFKGKKKLPNGREAYFEEVIHPGAALVVPFIKGKIVFIRQYRGLIKKYIWELPAGTLAPGETPYSCAKREITEETGYRVKGLKRIGVIHSSPGFCNEKIYIFRADCVSKGVSCVGEDELIKVKRFSAGEVRRLFKSGRISDSKTIAALTFAGIL